VKLKPEKKNSGLNGIRTHTGAVLYQLSDMLLFQCGVPGF